MEEEIVSGTRAAWSIGLVVFGCVVIVARACSSLPLKGLFRYMGLSAICILGGITGISPMLAALMVGMFALMFFVLLAMGVSDWWYTKRYPVFDGKPHWSSTDNNGRLMELYIAQVRSRFIIGIVYETEVDGTEMKMSTSWKDEFDSHDEAERELWRRAGDLGYPGKTSGAVSEGR